MATWLKSPKQVVCDFREALKPVVSRSVERFKMEKVSNRMYALWLSV